MFGVATTRGVSRPGIVFIALKGLKATGADFAADAIGEAPWRWCRIRPASTPTACRGSSWTTPERRWRALADEFYEHPSRSMQVVGITGTNGKTTTAYLLRARVRSGGYEMRAAGHGHLLGRRREAASASRTTPEAPDVQRMFRLMVDRGCGACVMEVSSHALALEESTGRASRPACSRI